MKKILLALLFLPFIGFSQAPILLDTVGNACHINILGFAKDGMTYSLYGDSSLNITIQGTTNNFSNAHYSRFRDPSGSSFANRQALTNWLDTYFFADAAASDSDTSGGGSATLEEVTGNGNTTPNSMLFNGLAGYSPANTGLTLGYTSGIGLISNNNPTFSSQILFNNDGRLRFGTGNEIDGNTSTVLDLYPIENSGIVGAIFNCRVQATEAFDAADLVSLGQVQNMWKGGQSLFTADGVTTVFDIVHNLGSTPPYFSLTSTTPVTLNNLNRTITFPDANTMRITFGNPPLIGENVNYVWIVYK